MGEAPSNYVSGKFYAVHLGDVLGGRYVVFRKLGTGSQSTIWLARDKHASDQRFVAIKVFGARTSETELKLAELLRPCDRTGKKHVEMALDSFVVHGPNGDHFCKVLEPLGPSLASVLEIAFERRARLNEPESWLGKASEGDLWSASFAKRACWQILLGLDYLHSQHVAHRDIQPANVCVALRYSLNSLSENEIQKAVWPADVDSAADNKATQDNEDQSDQDSDDDSDSDDTSEGGEEDWRRKFEEHKRADEEQWKATEVGDPLAEPHSAEWDKANFFNTRHNIELLHRSDGRPLGPGEMHYTVAATPLEDASDVEQATRADEPFRLVLVDLGFACAFSECEKLPLRNLSDFRPPETLIGVPATHAADIFSLGLLFWEVVMLRRLVETRFAADDPERIYQKNRLMRDLAQRLGPVTASVRARWRDAAEFVDTEGNALDIQEHDQQVYEPDDFEYGDIWHHAKIRKPWDMSDREMEVFVGLIQAMLQWDPESRPSTRDLLQHEWFKDLY
ncbi:hypothetical protein INS49_004030 [Diaporthe citri]|uniref:uncharacterized protein n=1 Tax=Diaporthe citri TaxID=83186 RepID=UPI001C810749|nr:uncharacterized protein INS49_004030 [Diaporthe citri]KAG6354949.1 hypothetical protein INS49_004030 [Diaporthe citri]